MVIAPQEPASTMNGAERWAELELPEEINLRLEVANVGSRGLAILVDLALIFLILFVVYGLSLLSLQEVTQTWFSQFSFSAIFTFLLLLIFGFQWGYFNLFEWIWNGQTPGKRLLRLRVIKSDGTPASWLNTLLRNLARPIDTFGPMALIGIAFIFTNRRAQRPGDLLAGTLVVHESAIDWSLFDPMPIAASSPARPPIPLPPTECELLHRFLHRSASLDPSTRRRIAATLRNQLAPFAAGSDLAAPAPGDGLAPVPLEDETWLHALWQRT